MVNELKLQGIVNSLDNRGFGVVKAGDINYHLPYVLPGEKIEFREKFHCSKFNRGEVLNIIEESNQRNKPKCLHFTKCGGCNLQHMKLEYYHAFKKSLLKEFGDIDSHFFSDGERRRAVFHVQKNSSGQLEIGFFAFESKKIIDISECHLLSQDLFQQFLSVKRFLTVNIELIKEKQISFSLTKANNGYELIFLCTKLHIKEFKLLAEIFDDSAIGRVLFKVNNNFVYTKEFFQLTIEMNNYIFPYPRGAFLQGSKNAEIFLSNQARLFSQGKNKILDLYCGIGPYSLASSSKKVDAYEGNIDMIESLQNLAQKQELAINAFCRDLYLNPVKDFAGVDGVIINPPQNGAERQIRAIADADVPHIMLVSCSFNELKRDLKILLSKKYRIKSMSIIDQFPWSWHIESCTFLEKL